MSPESAQRLIEKLPDLVSRGLAQPMGNRNTARPQWSVWVTPEAMRDPGALDAADMGPGSGREGKERLFVRTEPLWEEYARAVKDNPTGMEFSPKRIPSDELQAKLAELGHASPVLGVSEHGEYRYRIDPYVEHVTPGVPMGFAAERDKGQSSAHRNEKHFDAVARLAPRALVDMFTIPREGLREPIDLVPPEGPIREGDAAAVMRRRVRAFVDRGFHNAMNRAGGWRSPEPGSAAAAAGRRVRIPGADLVADALDLPRNGIMLEDFTDVLPAPFGWGSSQAHGKHSMLQGPGVGLPGEASDADAGPWTKLLLTELWPERSTLVDFVTRFSVGHSFTQEQEHAFRSGVIALAPDQHTKRSLERDWGRHSRFHRHVAAELATKNLHDKMVSLQGRGLSHDQFRAAMQPTVEAATEMANYYRTALGRQPRDPEQVSEQVAKIAHSVGFIGRSSTVSAINHVRSVVSGLASTAEMPPTRSLADVEALPRASVSVARYHRLDLPGRPQEPHQLNFSRNLEKS
jgi:hypothetical protein